MPNPTILKQNSRLVRSGYVTLLGLPNAGKSSFLNTLLGEEIAIVTPKAQTTWKSLQGYLVQDDLEAIVTDTPGIQTRTASSQRALNKVINQNAVNAVSQSAQSDQEIIAWIIDSRDTREVPALLENLKERLKTQKIEVPFKARLIPTLNKSDLIGSKERRAEIEVAVKTAALELSARVETPIWVSSATKEGVIEWTNAIKALLPELPSGSLFNPEDLSDKSVRAFCEDFIREQCFMYLQQEMPYSVAVEILNFDEKDPKITRIEAELHVERESQKRMVIGKGGEVLKKIGSASRTKTEKFLNKKVFLGLHVKVTPNWSKDASTVKRFGYSI